MTKKFPKVNQRQSFPQLEEEILKFWSEEKIFEESISSRPEENPYRFYDGPPFITGTPHYGSLLSSICKDVVPRYWTMKGKRVERVWGWDCHGLPIEDKVMKKLGLESSKDIEKVGVEKFIEECYAYTKDTSAEWDWYIEHIGRWVDTKNAYRTMDQSYMESVMWVFSELYKKGLIYKGQRVSLYSRKLSTPISNFEVAMDDSYEEVSDPAITVKFVPEITDVAAVMFLNNAGEVLLGKHEEGFWDFPGGKKEGNESIIETVQREIEEEMGLKLNASKLVQIEGQYDVNKGKIFKCEVFKYQVTNDILKEIEIQDKFSEWKFFPLDELPNDRAEYSKIYFDSLKNNSLSTNKPLSILAWTTTPWTIPAHMALAINKELSYVIVENGEEQFIVAKNLVEKIFQGKGEFKVLRDITSDHLIGVKYTPPFSEYYYNKFLGHGNGIILKKIDNLLERNEAHTLLKNELYGEEFNPQIFDGENNQVRNSTSFILVNNENNEIIGVAQIWEFETKKFALLNLAIKKSEQKKGYGSQLISLLERKVKEFGGDCIYTNASENIFNSFYKKIGFEKSNWNDPFRENDSIALEKKLIVDKEKNFCVYNANFVTDTDGTGIAHEAPEFGDVDFQLAKREGIHITAALDDEGRYTGEISDLKGMHFKEANDVISTRLKEMGRLFKKESINHRVAMCPRTATPLIYKAQDSWFIDIQSLKAKLIEENEGINWYPEHLKHGQFLKSMEGAPDWCISRTRYWGTPMPVWKGYDSEGIERDIKVFESKEAIERASGKTVTNLHKPYIDDITWQENGLTYKRIPEVLDVWMDSGSMPYAQMHYPFENKSAMESSYPADFIVEYIGQVRAWFYVMHVVGVALFDQRSFTNVITTGIVYGNDGRKMSKSYGNYPDPRATIQKYGADAIRFYMMNSPLLSGNNMSFKEEGIEEVIKKVILPFWNTYSFFTTYANIDNWSPAEGSIYFCRHGETDNNKNGFLNGGDDDTELNDQGKDQAYKAVEEFKQSGVEFDVIVYSPLSRAKETASIIWNGLGKGAELVADERLIEHKSGKFNGLHRDEVYKMLNAKDRIDVRRKLKSKEYNEVEDVTEFNARVLEAYKDIQQSYVGKNILIVAHKGTFRALIKDMYNLSMDEAFNIIEGVPNAKIFKLPGKKENLLDQWILSELQLLTKEIDTNMKHYRIAEATRPIVKFMDNLTNWYIRRSRKRFWKSENDTDKNEAYETLYEVLVHMTKLLAPFTPFIADHVYKNLTGNKSVHLEMFPHNIDAFIIKSINTQFDKTAELINLGLAWRQRKGLRVRQPLLSATIGEKLDTYYLEIIKEELNVKEIITLKNSESIAKKICKPNGKLIGPKFGKDVQKIISEAKLGNFKELTEGKIEIICHSESDSESKSFILEKEDYEIAFEKADESLDIEAGFGMVIALDSTLTPELVEEGIARDLVRYIQEGRKEADFQVDDRIEIALIGEYLEGVLSKFKDYIEKETLSKIYNDLDNPSFEKECEIETGIITIKLRK